MFFGLFSLSPTNSGYLSRVRSPFLPSEIIVNTIGDEKGSILICPVFGFLLFWPFLKVGNIFGANLEMFLVFADQLLHCNRFAWAAEVSACCNDLGESSL